MTAVRPLVRSLIRDGARSPLRSPLQRGSGGFNPASWFSAGERGFIYDPSDLSTLFQDAGGTTPVTASGQTVALMRDKSGRGNHLTLTNCVLNVDDFGCYSIAANGTSSKATVALDLSNTDKLTFVAAVQVNSTASAMLAEFTANATATNGAFYVFTHSVFNGDFEFGLRGTGAVARASGAATLPSTQILSCAYDIAQASTATEVLPRINGAVPTLGNTGVDAGTGNFASSTLNLFSRNNGASLFYNGRLYAMILRAAASTNIPAAESWAAARAHGMPPYTFAPTTFSDTGVSVAQSDYYLTSPFARTVFDTEATSLTLSAKCTINTLFPNYAALVVLVNGSYNQTVLMGADGVLSKTITLPAGDKVVEIVNGLQSRPDPLAAVAGTWLISVQAPAPLAQTFPTASNRILFYGDSITVGANSTVPQKDGYAMLVRSATANSVAVEGWGYRSLHEDCATSAARAVLVAKLAAYSPARIWLAIGTNDYGLNKWSAANFGSAYAALLDDLHAALPSTTIFCQTPIVRSIETANTFGNTLANYRTQIGTAQSTRSGYATLVDGSAFLTTGDLDDGIHPTTAGHITYSTAVRSVLGI